MRFLKVNSFNRLRRATYFFLFNFNILPKIRYTKLERASSVLDFMSHTLIKIIKIYLCGRMFNHTIVE